MTLQQCYGVFRPSWDVVERCHLRKGHKGHCGPLTKPPLAQEHSETSKQAARAIEPVRGALKARVLEAITLANGLTAQEIEDVTGLAGNTIRPRIVELVEANAVRDSGLTRQTKSKRRAVVWVAR